MRKSRAPHLILAFLTAVCLITVTPFPQISFAAAEFDDVTADHWAAGYIEFASQKGIIEGYPNPGGRPVFAPENSVTMEEAAAMLYRALNAAGMLKSTEDFSGDYAGLFDSNKIAGWSRIFVAYGLKYGIIRAEEIGLFTDDDGRGAPAPRLTAAIWTAKALGAGFAGAYSFQYTDTAQIPADSLPYIDALQRHGIMKGSLQTDGTVAFMPGAGIKRSEFAAIAGRVFDGASERARGAFDPNIEAVSFRGEIANIESSRRQVTLLAASGAEQVIFINAESQLVFNGKMVYNEFASIGRGQACVIAAMSFESLQETQAHIWLAPVSLSGVITGLTPLSEGCERVEIRGGEGDTVYYLKTRETNSRVQLSAGIEVNFIADGVKLIEII